MATPEPTSVNAESPESVLPRPSFALYRTTYFWLLLLVLSYIVPIALHQTKHLHANTEYSLSAVDFQNYVQAESKLRSAFPPSAFSLSTDKTLREVLITERQLVMSTGSLNIARRVIILQHLVNQPLKELFLTDSLAPALRRDGKSAAEITTELQFWRDLYQQKHIAPETLAADVALVRTMRLRYLENQVLSDLYTAANQKAQAQAYTAKLEQAGTRFRTQEIGGGILLILAFLLGLVLIVVYLVAAIDRKWHLVFRVATQPQKLGWADLLDAFLFYLGFAHGIGDIVGILALRYLTAPSPNTVLILSASVYVGTGIVALVYLLALAKRREVTLADIGLTTRNGLFSDIVYGLCAFCAVLPITLLLGFVSRRIFGDNSDTTPNPILPLIGSVTNPLARIVVFLLVAVAAPFFEELFFRGTLFSGLRKRYSWGLSAVLSAMLFAIVHPMQDWLPIFGLGLGLAIVREMRQSLVPGMTMHFLQNSMSFIVMSFIFNG